MISAAVRLHYWPSRPNRVHKVSVFHVMLSFNFLCHLKKPCFPRYRQKLQFYFVLMKRISHFQPIAGSSIRIHSHTIQVLNYYSTNYKQFWRSQETDSPFYHRTEFDITHLFSLLQFPTCKSANNSLCCSPKWINTMNVTSVQQRSPYIMKSNICSERRRNLKTEEESWWKKITSQAERFLISRRVNFWSSQEV